MPLTHDEHTARDLAIALKKGKAQRMWMLLTPREVELVSRPAVGENGHAVLLRMVQRKLDAINGDLELTDKEIEAIRMCERNWKQGYQPQFRALLEAAKRHA